MELEKIILKNIPQKVSNAVVKEVLTSYGVQLDGMIKLQQTSDTKERGKYISHDERFCYALTPINPELPRTINIDGYQVEIIRPSYCYICANSAGHKQFTDECPNFYREESEDIVAFQGQEDPLSNFYPCCINVFDQTFNSTEAAYQWRKAVNLGRPDIGDKILNSRHAGEAKRLAKQVCTEGTIWQSVKVGIMRALLNVKLASCTRYREELIDSGTKTIAEATGDTFWGTGLYKEYTKRTPPISWPGENTLGVLHMEIRHQLMNGECHQLQGGTQYVSSVTNNYHMQTISGMESTITAHNNYHINPLINESKISQSTYQNRGRNVPPRMLKLQKEKRLQTEQVLPNKVYNRGDMSQNVTRYHDMSQNITRYQSHPKQKQYNNDIKYYQSKSSQNHQRSHQEPQSPSSHRGFNHIHTSQYSSAIADYMPPTPESLNSSIISNPSPSRISFPPLDTEYKECSSDTSDDFFIGDTMHKMCHNISQDDLSSYGINLNS